MKTTRLPAALAPWAGTLSAISPELAVAFGPLLRRLDALVGEREPVADVVGDPDGLGGLARSGRPDQLLASEWLLADAYPDEFLRRFVDGELLHLAPEFRTPAVRGRIAALVDSGPTQAGAGRLVQLAALLVLHRRAAARGTELVVVVLGDPYGRRLTGDLAELLPAWLAARRPVDPTPSDVQHALDGLDAADQAWLLTSPRLAERLPARSRVLTSEPTRWSADGAGHAVVRLDGATAELPLPAGGIAVRALRGAEFRRADPVPAGGPAADPGGAAGRALPAFTTDARTLLARGRRATTLLAANLPNGDARITTTVRARRHDLPGPVLAAGRTGRRLIALYVRGGELVPYVSGRPLGERGGYTADLAAFGVGRDEAVPEELFARPVLPLLRAGADLLLPLAGRWWRIGPDGSVAEDGALGRGAHDRPHFNRFREPRLLDSQPLHEAARDAHHFLHGGGSQAWSQDGRTWQVRTRSGDENRISFRENADVIGLVHDEGTPVLITVSRSGLVVRGVRADGVRTLTRLSGGAGPPAVHSSLPLIAAETRPGRIVVGDAHTGRIHFLIGDSE
ncbi:hypothetical protein ACIPWI_02370 [Streptomyces sp. NPDC090046]|uniref:hypothetical protein n=1 Tax=Streptomyces sp. NPDC090046 TaxID=3365928 RepID=UPI0037F77512